MVTSLIIAVLHIHDQKVSPTIHKSAAGRDTWPYLFPSLRPPSMSRRRELNHVADHGRSSFHPSGAGRQCCWPRPRPSSNLEGCVPRLSPMVDYRPFIELSSSSISFVIRLHYSKVSFYLYKTEKIHLFCDDQAEHQCCNCDRLCSVAVYGEDAPLVAFVEFIMG